MKTFVQLTYIAIGLEVLDDGPVFSGITLRQERGSSVCKHRWTEEAKRKVCIFIYNIFTNSNLCGHCNVKPCPGKVTPLLGEAITKWRRFFLVFNFLAINALITVFSICTGNTALGHHTDLASSRAIFRSRTIFSSTDPKNSYYCIITKRTCK